MKRTIIMVSILTAIFFTGLCLASDNTHDKPKSLESEIKRLKKVLIEKDKEIAKLKAENAALKQKLDAFMILNANVKKDTPDDVDPIVWKIITKKMAQKATAAFSASGAQGIAKREKIRISFRKYYAGKSIGITAPCSVNIITVNSGERYILNAKVKLKVSDHVEIHTGATRVISKKELSRIGKMIDTHDFKLMLTLREFYMGGNNDVLHIISHEDKFRIGKNAKLIPVKKPKK